MSTKICRILVNWLPFTSYLSALRTPSLWPGSPLSTLKTKCEMVTVHNFLQLHCEPKGSDDNWIIRMSTLRQMYKYEREGISSRASSIPALIHNSGMSVGERAVARFGAATKIKVLLLLERGWTFWKGQTYCFQIIKVLWRYWHFKRFIFFLGGFYFCCLVVGCFPVYIKYSALKGR